MNKRTLIGTVGYHMLRNHSVAPILLPEIQSVNWPDSVEIEEMNWGPIAIVQYFQTLKISFDRVIFLVAIERPNREIGDITIFQWNGGLPTSTQIQACIGDAATGVISVENLLIIGEFFKIWPKDVYLIDVEPGPEQGGEYLTEAVERKIPEILYTLERITLQGISLEEEVLVLKGDEMFNDMNYENSRH
ncbi:hypothetical protein [Geojedonia litorea]|uniref:hypothetical protein n=1 Tax=Geojedonia litorea TaxID=1268269 RepID=UPI0036DB1A6E